VNNGLFRYRLTSSYERIESNRLLQIAVLESRGHAVDRGLVQSKRACLFVPAGDGCADDAGGRFASSGDRPKYSASSMAIAREAVGSPTLIDNGKFFLFSLVGATPDGRCPSSPRQRSLGPARKKTLDGAPAQPEASPLH
jgi:hypothetical protein